MHAHYLQHVPFEGLGCIRPWLEQNGYEITHTPLYQTDRLPALDSIDLLITMGGPMSTNDEEQYPWLKKEKQFIHNAIESGKPVLGICLGAQLIASAMGANVYKNKEKEIGWYPIQAAPLSDSERFQFPAQQIVFHWHGETFDLPEEAALLASSTACQNQAFQLGRNVIGLQFHLESTPSSVKEITTNCRDELISSPFVQTAEQILSAPDSQYQQINAVMQNILSYLTQTKV